MGIGSFKLVLTLGLLAAVVVIPRPLAAEESRHVAAIAQPLWSFVWVSDLHLDPSRREFIAKALHYIDKTLKPGFLLITGDNNALPGPATDPNRPEPLGLRRQRFFKAFLHEHLKTPCVVIPGDNWPEDFEKVFGATQYSFDYGGLHFVLLSPDRTYHGGGAEGLSVFDEPTWAWLRRDLERSRRQPTIVAIHEPVFPCTFLDGARLRALLDRYPHVTAVLQGHLHVDMEFRSNGRAYLVAPSLGKASSPAKTVSPAKAPSSAMKLVNVYPEKLVVRTIQYAKSVDSFDMTQREQQILIAEPLRGRLTRPLGPGLVMGNYDAVPPHAHREDPALAGRMGELWKILVEQSLTKDIFLWR